MQYGGREVVVRMPQIEREAHLLYERGSSIALLTEEDALRARSV